MEKKNEILALKLTEQFDKELLNILTKELKLRMSKVSENIANLGAGPGNPMLVA